MVNKQPRQHKKKRFISLLLVVVLVCIAALALHVGPFHKTKVTKTGSQFTKGEPSQSSTNSTSTSGASSTSVPATQSQKTIATSAVLVAPTGDFVSNHHPNLSGSPAPNTMSSVCNTTPGASCQINFTKDGVVKSLPSEVADAGGSAYWNWKLQDYGLTSGSWQIQAVTSLNGQTKSATDALDLVVNP